jgi:flagellar biosynthesis protein FlhF
VQYQNFRGADLKEALSAVKATLGPNALIEGTRQISNGRGGGLGHSYVEVTAAPPAGLKWPYATREAAAVEAPLRRREPRGQQFGRGAKPTPSLARDPSEIERELGMLRQMLNELNESRPPKERALTELHSAGIEGALARELSSGAAKVARRGRDALRVWLSGRIKERLLVTPPMLTDSIPRVIACVGPTGVGKTTTLAKLAARARLDHGRSVGVISLDTFRVGAVEQWQRYATLMGIPFQIASDRTSFQRAMADMPTDLVLVDTAGRSVRCWFCRPGCARTT